MAFEQSSESGITAGKAPRSRAGIVRPDPSFDDVSRAVELHRAAAVGGEERVHVPEVERDVVDARRPADRLLPEVEEEVLGGVRRAEARCRLGPGSTKNRADGRGYHHDLVGFLHCRIVFVGWFVIAIPRHRPA